MKQILGILNNILSILKSVVGFLFKDLKHILITVGIFLVIVICIFGSIANKKAEQEELARQQAEQEEQARLQAEALAALENVNPEDDVTGSDKQLKLAQEGLRLAYGEVPEGYIWDYDGSLLSLGDKGMTAEEVLYAYLNGLRTLDISMAQKYSRYSNVVNTYSSYFDSQDRYSQDYFDSFLRNMYKEVLLSMQVKGVEDISVFAENKQVFTVKLNLLDLSSKDFWLEDKYDIYNNLYIYSADEDDDAKSETYLYNYVLDYYRSNDAVTKDILVNITVERYPDLDTGWLVSIDKDIDDACIYSDGNLMVNYILQCFIDEGRDYVQNIRESELQKQEEETSTEDEETTTDTTQAEGTETDNEDSTLEDLIQGNKEE